MSSAASKRTGRRSGPTETREQIAIAARAQFAERGFERATFRAIAEAAGVDPALVVHFYGSKDDLFREVMQLPPGLADALVGIALARYVVLVEPLASLPSAEVVRLVAPTFQRFLTEPLD